MELESGDARLLIGSGMSCPIPFRNVAISSTIMGLRSHYMHIKCRTSYMRDML